MLTPRIAGRHSVDRRAMAERLLIGMELITGATGLAGGLLLALRPDGSLLHAQMSALENKPFTNWRLPGLLLASLVGIGLLGTGWWQQRRGPFARELSMFAGAGLVLFEASELLWIGPQPLEAVFATVGHSATSTGPGDRPPSIPDRSPPRAAATTTCLTG